MDFVAIVDQAIALLRQRGRLTYRTLQVQFQLDDAHLEVLKDELIAGQRLAVDEEGRVLVWTGGTSSAAPTASPMPLSATPEASPAQGEAAAVAPSTPEAERRQLTVLFCDLVDSTVLSSQLDPEDLREVVRAYQDTCAKVIARFEGHIAQYLGDGLLVYFGYPLAHEDDAQRAVHTGLGIVQALRTLNTRIIQAHAVRLAVRVGIHTGLVVVGAMGGGGRQERLALGETPNLAARLQGLALPDTVLLSAATWQLVQGYFTCQALGPQTLRGVPMAVHVYQAVQESGAQSRLDVASTRGLTPLVGREVEVALLRTRWAEVQDGQGHVIALSGEAGIGKSRLVQVLKDHIAEAPHIRIECRCSPYYQNSAFYPIIDYLERALHFQRDDAPETKLAKLERSLAQYRLPLHEAVPLFTALLSLPLPEERYAPLPLTPERHKQKMLEATLANTLELAERRPVLFILEDLHWADPSTLEFLQLLLTQGPTTAILTVVTYRPDFHPPWGLCTHHTPLALQRLSPAHVEAMVTQVTGGNSLPTEIIQHVVTNADGVPLFVEELTKTIVESGILRQSDGHYALTGPFPTLAIPTTLQDALMARLDRLNAVKAVAQLGATLGRTFTYDLLQAVTPLDEATLQQGLRQLVAAEMLYQRDIPPRATYRFKHALLQEAAYQSLLKSTRQQYHQHIAQVLESQFPEMVATQPELLAHHCTEAGLTEQAVTCWQQAGQQAVRRSAYVEALHHFTTALALLTSLPDSPERTQQELTLHLAMSVPLMATKGYAAPEVEHAYARARELCQHMGDTPQLFPVLRGLAEFYVVRGELHAACTLGEQLLSQAQSVQHPTLLLGAHTVLGVTLFYIGEFASSRAHLAQGMAHYDSQQHRVHTSRTAQDPGVLCLTTASWALWGLGYPDQALEHIHEALALAGRLAHPHSLARALIFAAGLHMWRREELTAQERADAAITLSTEQGFPLWVAAGTSLRGWALAMQGHNVAGIAQLRQGLDAWRATGAEVARPYFLALLAEAYKRAGHAEDGQTVLAEALELVHKAGERFYAGELYRLHGELLLERAVLETSQVESCCHRALDIARRQQAKSLELRAAVSLSRLWQQQGKRTEAYALLAPIYEWFTEGFDTADLQEAKALLEELAG